MLNIRDFDAVGDGRADDTAALQKAAACGQEVYFPAGTYLLRKQINVPSALHWCGEGEDTVIKLLPADLSRRKLAKYIDDDGNEVEGMVSQVSMLSMEGGDMLEVRRMTFDAGKDDYKRDLLGNGSTRFDHVIGIYASGTRRIVLDEVTIRNALIEGVYIEFVNDIRITRSRFIGNGFTQKDSSGVQICCTNREPSILISDCIFEENGFNGLLLTSVCGAAVNNIICRKNGYEGVALWGGSHHCILSNIVSQKNRGGLTFKRSAGPGFDEPDDEKGLYRYSSCNIVTGLVTIGNRFGIIWGCAKDIIINNWIGEDMFGHCLLYRNADEEITASVTNARLFPEESVIRDECDGHSMFHVSG